MLRISGTNIMLTRGDSAYITLTIADETGAVYSLAEGDAVKIQVRKAPNYGELLFDGTIEYGPDGEVVWHILPDDTAHTEVTTYYYDAQLCTANGDVFTFIPSAKFKLLDEVTCNGA